MAIALDASTPSFNSTNGQHNLGPQISSAASDATLDSASFSPPAASLVTVLATPSYSSLQSFASTGLTVSDSIGNTYSIPVSQAPAAAGFSQAYGAPGIFTFYYASAPGIITVTADLASANIAANATAVDLAVLVWTGCAANQSGAATLATSFSSGTTDSAAISVTSAGSQAVIFGFSGATASSTAAAGTTLWAQATSDSESCSPAWGYLTSLTTGPGPVTAGYTAGNVFGHPNQLIALELLAQQAAVVTATQTIVVRPGQAWLERFRYTEKPQLTLYGGPAFVTDADAGLALDQGPDANLGEEITLADADAVQAAAADGAEAARITGADAGQASDGAEFTTYLYACAILIVPAV